MRQHRVLGYREWSDREPDTIRVGVEVGDSTGLAFVTFTGHSSTWLTPEQVAELGRWATQCGRIADRFNHGDEFRYVVVPEHDGRRWWLGNGDCILMCGCKVGCTYFDNTRQRVDLLRPGPHLREPTSEDGEV